eukprot:TRINITY_DN9751_c0_g1_i1.p1 TRINITY_DN9751_c0_g1~~TRINITY_DN9751_c0_g1_i1.p1  ORF type:complete len:294 (+),score=44.96 TRINITY_DN9751_c0_g1_i1:56-883(+)
MKRAREGDFDKGADATDPLTKRVPQSEGELKAKYEKTCELYRMMQHCAAKLRLPQLTVATGMAYFHKYHAKRAWRSIDPVSVAAACLFLASKAEGTPCRIRDIVAGFFRVAEEDTGAFSRCRGSIVDAELQIVVVLNFDFAIAHPHEEICVKFDGEVRGSREWRQLAWQLATDSYNTSACIKYPAQSLAHALIHIAAVAAGVNPSDKTWVTHVPVAKEVFDRVRSSLLNFYHFSRNARMIAAVEGREPFRPKPLVNPSTAPPRSNALEGPSVFPT